MYSYFWVILRRLNFVCVCVCVCLNTTYEDGTGCSETSARKIQTSGNHTKETMQHSQHGESLQSRTINSVLHSFVVIFSYYRTQSTVKDGQTQPLYFAFVFCAV